MAVSHGQGLIDGRATAVGAAKDGIVPERPLARPHNAIGILVDRLAGGLQPFAQQNLGNPFRLDRAGLCGVAQAIVEQAVRLARFAQLPVLLDCIGKGFGVLARDAIENACDLRFESVTRLVAILTPLLESDHHRDDGVADAEGGTQVSDLARRPLLGLVRLKVDARHLLQDRNELLAAIVGTPLRLLRRAVAGGLSIARLAIARIGVSRPREARIRTVLTLRFSILGDIAVRPRRAILRTEGCAGQTSCPVMKCLSVAVH
jgi:hypothetical protein